MGVAVGGEAVATVEVPAHVGEHRLGVLGEEVGVDDRGDHGMHPASGHRRFRSVQHVAQRPSERRGGRSCVVVLDLHPSGADLDPDRVPVDDDGALLALLRPALHDGAAQAERPGLAHEHAPTAARRRAGSHSAWTVCAGRPFFITIGVAQASWAPAASSAAIVWAMTSPVASSTLVSSSCTGWPGAGVTVVRGRVADDDLHDVRSAGDVGAAGAVADGEHVHRRHRAELVGQRRHQRDAGGRGQLACGRRCHGSARRAGEQLHRRRRRVGQLAVRRRAPCPGRR